VIISVDDGVGVIVGKDNVLNCVSIPGFVGRGLIILRSCNDSSCLSILHSS